MTWDQSQPITWDFDRANWMGKLPDDTLIRDMTIPGTHDSAALLGFTHFNVSVTQELKIREQLDRGIRFLDLRVNIMFLHKGLAMYHGADALYDPENPHSFDQLYYKAVISECIKFLRAHEGETIIVSLKSDGVEKYDGWTIEDWFRQIANEVAADNAPGTWTKWWSCRPDVNAKLSDVRGKLVLWRRFPRGGQEPNQKTYEEPFALDLMPLNGEHDNTSGAEWRTPLDGFVFAQDLYKPSSVAEKFKHWHNAAIAALDSRSSQGHDLGNRQFLNFTSIGAGKNPGDYAIVMNPAVTQWLRAITSGQDAEHRDIGARRVRTGLGVIPMDIPNGEQLELLIRANFGWVHCIHEQEAGKKLVADLIDWISKHEP